MSSVSGSSTGADPPTLAAAHHPNAGRVDLGKTFQESGCRNHITGQATPPAIREAIGVGAGRFAYAALVIAKDGQALCY